VSEEGREAHSCMLPREGWGNRNKLWLCNMNTAYIQYTRRRPGRRACRHARVFWVLYNATGRPLQKRSSAQLPPAGGHLLCHRALDRLQQRNVVICCPSAYLWVAPLSIISCSRPL
jgi:hypothetical protein